MKFEKTNFNFHGGYLTYNSEFIARFKYNSRDRGPFVTFLCKKFTVEEYTEMYKSGVAPLQILRSKGYISPNEKRALKAKQI